MTLGGLALAVGILVDDATVTIENVERHSRWRTARGTRFCGAGEIALPAMVSTLCICIVFVPMFFLTGVAGYLSRRWPWRSYLQCSLPMCCPGRLCRP